MFVRLVFGSLAGAVVLMVWGFFFWVVLLPPGKVILAAPGELALVETLTNALPESGTYFIPQPPYEGPGGGEGEIEEFRARYIAGPIVMLHYNVDGTDPLSLDTYLRGFVHFLVTTVLAGLILLLAMPGLDSYGKRVFMIFSLGVFAAVAVRLSDPIWWRLPWPFHIYGSIFLVSGWLFAGIAMAWIIHPKRGYTHVTDSGKPLWKRALDVD